jgi:hypothetical protein
MLLTDQVAIAPCTDCVQAQRPTFEAKQGARVRESAESACTRYAVYTLVAQGVLGSQWNFLWNFAPVRSGYTDDLQGVLAADPKIFLKPKKSAR